MARGELRSGPPWGEGGPCGEPGRRLRWGGSSGPGQAGPLQPWEPFEGKTGEKMSIKRETPSSGAGRGSTAQPLGPDPTYQPARPPRGVAVGFLRVLCRGSRAGLGQALTARSLPCSLPTGPALAAGSEGRARARRGEAPVPTSPCAPAPPRPLGPPPAAASARCAAKQKFTPGCRIRPGRKSLWQKV